MSQPPPPPSPLPAPPPGPAAAPGPGPGQGWVQPAVPGRSRSRRPWVVGCLILLVVLGLAIGGCAVVLWRTFGGPFAVVQASNGQIDSFNVSSGTNGTRITFQAARGLDVPDGPRLACEVVRPNLAGTDLANATWVIVNRAGDLIASNLTPCP